MKKGWKNASEFVMDTGSLKAGAPAMGIIEHEGEFQFCHVCGGALESRSLNPGEPRRLVCSACGFVFYLDPKVVACCLVEKDGKVLLLKRAVGPGKGKWVFLGGFVDRRESVETAALREAAEETGLTVRIERLLGVYSYQGQVPVVIVYVAEPVSGTLSASGESLEAASFREEDIPWDELAFQSTREALRDFYHIKRQKRRHVQ